MDMEANISVVMALYNGRKYIKEQLESIIHQTIKIHEIILIDDCSSDPCDDIVNNYIAQFGSIITYIKHNENRGYAQTFFEALSLSTGNYIFFSDQDDIWMPNKVEEFIKMFQEQPNALCISSRNIIIDGNGDEIKRENKLKAPVEVVGIEPLIKKAKIRPGMSIAISRKLKDEIDDIDTSKFESHDRFIEFVACRKNGFYLFDQYLTKYRIHGSNTAGMNLSHGSLRSDRQGRIAQIDKEIRYLLALKNYDNSFGKVIDKHINYYNKRRTMLDRNNPLYYVFGSVNILYGYRDSKIWFGDILSMIKR